MRSGRTSSLKRWAAGLGAACLTVTLGLVAAAQATPAAAASRASSTRSPSRVTYIGAYSPSVGTWKKAYAAIGPLQTDKEFNTKTGTALPPSFRQSECASLPHNPVCIVNYKVPNTNLKSYVQSVPPGRNLVILVYHDEPELGQSGLSATQFKDQFENQARKIMSYAKEKGLKNVKVAMDSATSGYKPGAKGYNCSFIPPAKYVDYYLADVYEHTLTGLASLAIFQRWNHCTAGKGVPRGLAEYGLDRCDGATEAQRATTLGDDAAYLARKFPKLVLWNYWYADSHPGACHDPMFPARSATGTEWRKIEAGTVAS